MSRTCHSKYYTTKDYDHMLSGIKSVEIHHGEFFGTSNELLEFLRVAGAIGYASCMVELSSSDSHERRPWLIEVQRPIAQGSMHRDENVKHMTDAFTKSFEQRFAFISIDKFKELAMANRYGHEFINLRSYNHVLSEKERAEVHSGKFVGTSSELLEFLRITQRIGYPSHTFKTSISSSQKSKTWVVLVNRPIVQNSSDTRDESIERMNGVFSMNFEQKFGFINIDEFKTLTGQSRI